MSTERNPLELSDEDFLNLPDPEFEEDPVIPESEEELPGEQPADEPVTEEEEEAGEEEDTGEDPDGEAPEKSVDQDSPSQDEQGEAPDAPAEGAEADAKPAEEKPADEPDYKAMYEAVMAPIRANNKDLKLDTPEDLRRLASMGAGFNKKMSVLKPHLATIKMLERQDLLEESKLSHLIDLAKGDRGAIAKLLQDHNIDPLELNDSGNTAYKPGTYTVDAREVELDTVLDELKETSEPAIYSKTLDVLTNKWDEASRNALVGKPEEIRILHRHVKEGIYDRVIAEVEAQKIQGRLIGMSDLQAYQIVGDVMNAQGKFNDLQPKAPEKPAAAPAPAAEVAPIVPSKPTQDAARREKKRAASPSNGRTTNKTSDADFNPLAMSDEAFMDSFDETLL